MNEQRAYRYGDNVKVFGPYWRWFDSGCYLEPDRDRPGCHRVDIRGNVWSVSEEYLLMDVKKYG